MHEQTGRGSWVRVSCSLRKRVVQKSTLESGTFFRGNVFPFLLIQEQVVNY